MRVAEHDNVWLNLLEHLSVIRPKLMQLSEDVANELFYQWSVFTETLFEPSGARRKRADKVRGEDATCPRDKVAN